MKEQTISTSLNRIARTLHESRFGRYVAFCGGDSDEALRLYCWNLEVSAAFWGEFHVLEVALRNHLNNGLVRHFDHHDWWSSVALTANNRRSLRSAISLVELSKGELATPGHIVAELSFGFWIGLLANRYHAQLWVPVFEASFPGHAGRRADLHQPLDRLRKMRNRIAHHEPIFTRRLTDDHDEIMALISFIDSDTAAWANECSRVPEVIAARTDTLSGVRQSRF